MTQEATRRLILIVMVVLAALGAQRALAQDLLVNGDFTRGGIPPAGWVVEAAAASKGALAVRPASAGQGGPALVLTPNAGNTPSDKPYGIGQVIPASGLRGRTVTFSASLGGAGGATAVAGLAVLAERGVIASVHLRNGGAIGQRSETVAVPDDRTISALVVFLVTEGTSGSASFSSVAVRAGAAQPSGPGAPGNRATRSGRYDPGPDLSARVRLDTAQVIRVLPRTLFGTNTEVIQDGQGVMDLRNRRLQPQIVTLARDLHLGPIRFPGGVWSDAYDWRKGIGPMDRRPTQEAVPGAGWTYRHVFGTDEALAFAREVGTTLMITVNAGTGTAQLAADWVRYVNGEGGAAPRGPRVELWEIGNEIYMADDASGGHMSPRAYAARVKEFASAMKGVDPNIRIAAIGLKNFGRYRLNKYEDWNEVVLREASSAIDILAIHNAYSPVVGDDPNLEPADVYAGLWAFPRMVAKNLEDTWNEVERVAPGDSRRITLGITEWGPLFGISPQSPWVHHVRTLGSAVFVASVFKVFAEHPRVDVANFFKLHEASFMGWIGKRGSEWIPTAPYLAFRMISRDMESHVVRASVDAPTYDSSTVGAVDAQSAVPVLDAFATKATDGRTVTVLLINKTLTSSINTRIEFAQPAGVARVLADTLTAATADANTGSEILRQPGLTWTRQRAVGPDGRIDRGGPNEIQLSRVEIVKGGASPDIRVPPHSLVLVRFEGVERQ